MALPRPRDLPDVLSARWVNVNDRLSAAPELVAALSGHPGAAHSAARVLTVSEFVLRTLLRYPEQFVRRLARHEWFAPLNPDALQDRLTFSAEEPEAQVLRALRMARQLELARIAWRDLTGDADLAESLADLSAVAECCIEAAMRYAMDVLTVRYGQPSDERGESVNPVVLGMGKLGGGELNFSSDVDLIFLYDAPGTTNGDRPLDNGNFFIKLGQHVIRLLDAATADGAVYRVDTRLRPFGSAGPLAVSFPALEAYLIQHGRDWERYAYIKAKPVTTAHTYPAELFEQILAPFVYRRYLDYGVFASLRDMKGLIAQEVARKDMSENIKLGPGGIREIEFIVQSFQLVRGGQDVTLRRRQLLQVLPRLADRGCLSPAAANELANAYRFLRTVENRLQALDDQQTHDLPGDPELRARLAMAMGCDRWSDLAAQLGRWRTLVEGHFAELVFKGTQPGGDAAVADNPLRALWELGLESDPGPLLADLGVTHGEAVVEQLRRLRHGGLYQRMDEPSRARLDNFIPRLLEQLVGQSAPEVTLARLLPLIEAVGRRSAYLALLIENPAALQRLVDLAERSDFLPAQIVESPMLLDELLDPRILDQPPSRASLKGDFAQLLAGEPPGDTERLLEAMRRFQRMAVFRIAVADLAGALPLMKVSDRLTDTAELVLEFALATARRELTERYGTPLCGDPAAPVPAEFCIVAYGKLAGLELGYGSDLDLVFLHHNTGTLSETDGAQPLDNQRFFARLTQRLLHFLTIQTPSGRLYEVDTRLRPSGRSGLMVASLDAFAAYQRRDAWTWEHQALLRSRSVAGDAGLRALFEQERREVLCHHVKREQLAEDVRTMRARMRRELSKGGADRFDIKQDAGGLADLEFLVDYWVLRSAGDWPELVTYPDNVRQLEALERVGLITSALASQLRSIYLSFRRRLHALALAGGGRVVAASEFRVERDRVRAVWARVLGE
jgi:glutamate-ammonia-ligase adenylyltransferase